MRLEGTDLSLDSIESDTAAYTRYAISYRSNGVKVTGILNIPKGDEQFPLLIFNHGYIDPAVYTQGRGLKREQDYMARQGFAVLHTDYRGHAGGDENPDKTEVYDAGLGYTMDSINAILAVKNANLSQIDTSKVGMLGHSMGGGVTMNAAIVRPDLIDAIVLYAPVHSDPWQNFLRWRADSRGRDVKTREVLKSREENPDAWDAMAARPRLSKIDAPVLLFQGTADKDVPAAWSDELETDLKSAGVDVTYIKYSGEGHEFGPKWGDFMQRSAEFFRASLR
jgi:dipeptidyl aminopeptidase/acylaminoacyl peptidase